MKKQSKKTASKKPTVYVLELWGDIANAGSAAIFEIAGVSTDKSVLEKLKAKKDKELDKDYPESNEGEGDEDGECFGFDEGEYTLQNTDLSSRPWWQISKYRMK